MSEAREKITDGVEIRRKVGVNISEKSQMNPNIANMLRDLYKLHKSRDGHAYIIG